MAKAARKTEKVERVITEDKEVIVIELSVEEARTLARVLARIGGDCKVSRRIHTESISATLANVGIYNSSGAIELNGNLFFPAQYNVPA